MSLEKHLSSDFYQGFRCSQIQLARSLVFWWVTYFESPFWLREKLFRQKKGDLSLGDSIFPHVFFIVLFISQDGIDLEGLASEVYVTRFGVEESWSKDSVSKETRSVFVDDLPWEVIPLERKVEMPEEEEETWIFEFWMVLEQNLLLEVVGTYITRLFRFLFLWNGSNTCEVLSKLTKNCLFRGRCHFPAIDLFQDSSNFGGSNRVFTEKMVKHQERVSELSSPLNGMKNIQQNYSQNDFFSKIR